MNWIEEHNIMLCMDMLIVEPYHCKIGSRKRGHCWEKIATNLTSIAQPRFIVGKRAVRDHFFKLLRDYKRKMAVEESASGIKLETSELYEALKTIIGRTEGAVEEIARSNERKSKEVETVDYARKRATESSGESRKREDIRRSIKKRTDRNREAKDYLKGRQMRRLELELVERKTLLPERAQNEGTALKKQEMAMKEQEMKERQKDAAARESNSSKCYSVKFLSRNQLLLYLLT